MADEKWKNTGKELGSAFKGIGKAFIKSAKYTAEKAEAWAEKDDNAAESPAIPTDTPADASAEAQAQPKEGESSVFRDGTWRNAGKGLAHALKGLGSTVLDTVDNALDPKPSDNEEKKN